VPTTTGGSPLSAAVGSAASPRNGVRMIMPAGARAGLRFIARRQTITWRTRAEQHPPYTERNRVKIVEIVLALLLPPVAVAVKTGLSRKLLIALLLELLGHIPAVIYALYVVSRDQPTPA
jgi:uncharacterized membrane protein YqaE (UPF0057 family)